VLYQHDLGARFENFESMNMHIREIAVQGDCWRYSHDDC